MRVVIAGGHGKIAMELTRMLAERGDVVRSLIRNPEHASEVRGVGAEEVVVCDLEQAAADAVAEALGEADALVFAAGAGPGSGAARKESMDLGGALKLIEATQRNGVRRFVMVSSMSADPDRTGEETFDAYLRAKGRADAALAASGLDHTVVRPGGLTDGPGSGLVRLGRDLPGGEIPRQDVAAVLAAVLRNPIAIGRTIDVVSGSVPIPAALDDL